MEAFSFSTESEINHSFLQRYLDSMEKHRPRSEEKDWKSRLQEWEQGTGTQSWDTPTDGLWDRIAGDLPQSPPPEKKKAAWIWWSLAGLLLLLVVIVTLNRPINSDAPASPVVGENSVVQDVSEKKPVIKSNKEKIERSSTSPSPIGVDAETESAVKKEAETKSETSVLTIPQPSQTNEVDPGDSKARGNKKTITPVAQIQDSSGAAAGLSVANNSDEDIATPANIANPQPGEHELAPEKTNRPISEETNEATTTAVLASEQLSVVNRIPSLLEPIPGTLALNLGEPQLIMAQNPKWYLGLQASIPPSRQQTQGPHRIRQQSFDPRLELWVGRELGSRWQLELGYAQEGVQLQRQTSFIRRFDPQNEQVQNDQNVTVYKLNVLDDSGSTNQEVEVKLVRRPGQSILPGDRVLIQTDIQEQLRIRSIPVRVGYDLLRFRSWQLQALAGVEWQQQYRSIELERVMVQHPWFDPLVLSDQQRQREQQKEMFRFTTGVRTSIQLSPRFGLYVQPQWSWGNATVKTQDFHLNGGVFWRF